MMLARLRAPLFLRRASRLPRFFSSVGTGRDESATETDAAPLSSEIDSTHSDAESAPPVDDSLAARSFVIEPIGAHKQTLIWLTGIGDLKTNFKHIFDMMTLRGVRLVVPQSPMLPVSAFGEKVMPTWFDMPARISRESDPLTIDEDRIGILLAAHSIFELLEHEQKSIGSENTILGGASVGGALAVHAGLRHKHKLGGIISISGFVPLLQEYPKFFRKANRGTEILAINGFEDSFVPSEFARLTFDLLKTHGACIEYHEDRDMDHRLGDRSVFFLKKWIETHSSGAKPAVL